MTKYIDKDKVLAYIIFGVVGKDITCGELKRAIESFPAVEVSDDAISPVEPDRPKGTETMMVDGEPMEIDPVSYEVGYTHGQFSDRPKGKWKYGNGHGECPFCGHERQYGWDNFCGFCGADMRGDKE